MAVNQTPDFGHQVQIFLTKVFGHFEKGSSVRLSFPRRRESSMNFFLDSHFHGNDKHLNGYQMSTQNWSAKI